MIILRRRFYREELVAQLRRELLRDAYHKGGTVCCVCDEHNEVYARTINQRQVIDLALTYRVGSTRRFVHVPSEVHRTGRELAKLRWWGLVEESLEVRKDGGRAGWWRVLPDGEAFLHGELEVREVVREYRSEVIGFEGGWVNVHDAYRSPFDLQKLYADSALWSE